MIASSLTCRVLRAVWLWLAALGQSSRVFAAIGRGFRASGTHRMLARWLGAEPRALASSRYTRAFTNENARLSRKTKLRAAIESSLLCRIYRAVLRCGQNSRILSWLFSGGVTGLILVCIGLYAGIDYVLRDLLAIPVLSSMWDEALLLFAALWICGQRVEARSPLAARTTPMDCGILLFLTAGFVLMNVNAPFFSIQVSGFRASCQYLLWFFIVTRILRDDRDVMRLYGALVGLGVLLALHGIYQYIVAVPIPASWMTHTETAVRTRVYSIFGSPNIMGDFMVMVAPMCAGLAYCVKDTKWKIAAWIGTILMCIACLFTMSRASWVAMAIAVVIFVLLVDRRLLALLAVAGIGACFVPFVRTRIGFLFTDDFAAANTSGGRAGRKLNALNLFYAGNPWVGVGEGMFGGAVAMQNQVLDGIDYFYVDNYFLKTMVEMGYCGLAAFCLMLLGFLGAACRALYRKAADFKAGLDRLFPLCAGMFAGLCGVIVHCFFENIFEEPYMMAYFWSIAGLLAYIGFLRKEARA